MSNGSVFKKCGCRQVVLGADAAPVLDGTGKPKWRRLGASCPKLRRGAGWSSSHGSWHFQIEFTVHGSGPAAGRQVIARGGLSSRGQAEAQLSAVQNLLAIADRARDEAETIGELKADIAARIRQELADTGNLPDYDAVRRAVAAGQPLADRTMVGEWLTSWLAGKTDLAPGTRRVYACHVEQYLIPHLGTIPLDGLRVQHVQAMISTIAAEAKAAKANNAARRRLQDAARQARRDEDTDAWRVARAELSPLPPYRRPCSAATRSRIRATLRSALSAACAQQLVVVNVAALVDMPAGRPPKARVWTPERVARWRATGEVPSAVMVWTPVQTKVFLERAGRHRLCALFHLLTFSGLRRGEAVGLRWEDVDLPSRQLTVQQQVIQLGWETRITRPKSESSERDVPLSVPLAAELTGHRERQETERAVTGEA